VGAITLGLSRTPADPAVVSDPKAEPVRYGRDVRPILSDRCFKCHGLDHATLQAGLRLDRREEAIAPGKDRGPAIVPGNPDASELLKRVCSSDPKVMMPPPDSAKGALTPEQRDVLRRWIAEGAPYEEHWAFQTPKRPEAPSAGAWGKNPIDGFIVERLRKASLEPSGEADPTTLVRRAFLDLTGLPPTPGEVDAAVGDGSEGWYERLVDRLMGEEPYRTRYAERMTAAWLDQARYADTCGIHMDAGRQMWSWRDWVLKAYRDNMRFDRFVTEQLAGDLIPDATVSQKVASGFNRNHVTTDEGGAIAEEYLVEYAVDRTATTGSVFLGLTVGCARCHDHKFDPITTQDFYSLYAFFNSIEEPGLYSQTPDFNRAYEPFIAVPSPEQETKLASITNEVTSLRKELDVRSPEEEAARKAFLGDLWARAGVAWASAEVAGAASSTGATVEPQSDGSVRVSGANPERDDLTITMRTTATGLRLLALEALEEPTLENKIGRAENGNVVISGIVAEAVSVKDPSVTRPVEFVWAWADYSQENGDYDITNVLDPDTPEGWALRGHERPAGRVAVLLAKESFGFEGGTDVKVTIRQQSIYARHTIARPRISLASISDAGVAMLPVVNSRWYVVGPFPGDKDNRVWEPEFGPEQADRISLAQEFGEKKLRWRYEGGVTEGKLVGLAGGRNVTYLGKRVYAPTARESAVSLGSDDGFRLFSNAKEVASRQVERAGAPDQDKGTVPLAAGRNTVVMKVVNTGGNGAFYYKGTDTSELPSDMVAALIPEGRRPAELSARVERAWRIAFLPRYRETESKIAALEMESATITAQIPQTMVMKELATPRETFVLTRGQYDKPDPARKVERAVPHSLGKLPDGAPANRLGLAQWMLSEQNPLTARVTMNRLWEQFFGTGIVATSEDFGYQGEWPSHPELLDWLAVEFRESGWDVQHMIKLVMTSATYRQSSKVRAECREIDPSNRLLASFPRRRLTAEQIRDQALYVSGLLVEKMGGPSVKPYQPDGLWQEVAMPQSNTRAYQRGNGADLWRRSLYTYWKRAVPPPSMLTFDAPTRESCVTRRIATSTPLQALVLWNDEQFQEAARVLAQRTIAEEKDDTARVVSIFRRLVARAPDDRELAALTKALAGFRERYQYAPWDAAGVTAAGDAPRPENVSPGELAAWTMLGSAVMNLYEATTQE
jgi:hypothetical protein